MKRIIIALTLIILLITGCAEYIDVNECVEQELLGFWHGLWHGIIAPIHLIIMLFSDKFVVFAANNNGFWYSFGFILGSGGWGFLGAKGSRKR